jgi:hypothetical protein
MKYTIEELSKRAIDIQNASDEIVARYNKISSLQEAAVWKSDAIALQNLLNSFEQDLIQFQNIERGSLQEEESARKNLSFIKRYTTSKDTEKKHKGDIVQAQKGIDSITVARSVLAGIIDETPTNNVELKQKLTELNIHKKELTVDKRTVNEEMRQIRTSARQARASLSGVTRGTMGRMATYSRAGITRGKENKLSPLESEKGSIENQLIETEKKINRLKSINVDEEGNIESHVLRCSYCGRRVNFGELCPGCGSDKTTYALN